MKTTLNIDNQVMARLRREAALQGTTMSELVETALRRLLSQKPEARALPPLPTFHAGRTGVDVANREALYSLMDEG
ncbi:MAG: ribbon-helix-helix protein, CopG family [Gemmatimonadaceae bacterium]